MRETFDISTGLLFTGSLLLLLLAYYVRFAAVAMNGLDAGLTAVPPQMHLVARTLGERPLGVMAPYLFATYSTCCPDGGADRVCRCNEGTACHADHAPVEL